jgi:hypothetical protein
MLKQMPQLPTGHACACRRVEGHVARMDMKMMTAPSMQSKQATSPDPCMYVHACSTCAVCPHKPPPPCCTPPDTGHPQLLATSRQPHSSQLSTNYHGLTRYEAAGCVWVGTSQRFLQNPVLCACILLLFDDCRICSAPHESPKRHTIQISWFATSHHT